MKKSLLFITIILTAAVVFTACEPEQKNQYAGSEWLIGTWSNSGAIFTINKDFTFECDLLKALPVEGVDHPAWVTGKLDKSNSILGPNDYLMVNMTTAPAGFPDESYTIGNDAIRVQVEGFSGQLIGTLTPNSEKTQFVFTSNIPVATLFFGGFGPYVKD